MPILLAGLIWRRLYRIAYFFTASLIEVWSTEVLILLWPARFHRWGFWQAKETAFGLLIFGTALELVAYTFKAFPGARATARGTLLVGLAFILIALLSAPIDSSGGIAGLAQELQPRLANGTALLLAGLWALVLWYNLPIHPFHRAILRGLVPYLLVFTVLVRLLATLGWRVREEAALADGVSWLVVVLYWTVEAWRRPRDPGVGPDVMRALQPWRDRL
jgi:hypothetical protein